MKISFWRIFWPTFIAIIVASVISLFSFFGILGGIVSSFSTGDEVESNASILRMKLEGTILENSKSDLDPYSLTLKHQVGLSDLLFGLDQAKKDKSIKGIYLELANVRPNTLLGQRKSEFRVFTEGWAVYDVREGRGRLLFAN